MAWMHASSSTGRKSERWPTAPFASSITGLPCKSLDSYEPPDLCQRTLYILSCSSDPSGAAGHRKIFKQELTALDVAHRKLLRRVVGPPAGMDWSRPWHEILHDWNVRVSNFCGPSWLETLVTHMFGTTLETWSICGEFTLWQMVTSLTALEPIGQRRVGRPRQQWDDMLRMFCRYKRLGEWELAARDGCNWETLLPEFIIFCNGPWRSTFERQ